MEEVIYSKCMACGKVRRKGTKEWLPKPDTDTRNIKISHGYCGAEPCMKKAEEKFFEQTETAKGIYAV